MNATSEKTAFLGPLTDRWQTIDKSMFMHSLGHARQRGWFRICCFALPGIGHQRLRFRNHLICISWAMGTSGVDNYIVVQDMGTSGADFEIHCSGFSGLWSTAESIAESVLCIFPKSIVLHCLGYGHQRQRVRNPLCKHHSVTYF